ncbi:MAG: hypothetical protein ACYTFQ_14145 [Planctomycetota bacterium]|jgi:hypothetical protein
MMFIVCPIEGYWQLCETDASEAGFRPLTYALPIAEFRAWLRSSGNEAKMEAEDPDRMERVRRDGVGVLTCNKQGLIDAGFNTRDETRSKRPPDNPELIDAVSERER